MNTAISQAFSSKKLAQIFVNEDYIRIRKIDGVNIISDVILDINEKKKLLEYLEENTGTSVDLIVHGTVISCLSLSSLTVNNTDIKNIIKAEFKDYKNKKHVYFYTNANVLAANKKHDFTIFKLDLDDDVKYIIEALNMADINLNSVVPWSYWVVESYFEEYGQNKNISDETLLVVKHGVHWEIMLHKNGAIKLHRYGNLSSFDEHAEIENTLNYIAQLYGSNASEMEIVNLDEKSYDQFVCKINKKISVSSKAWDFTKNQLSFSGLTKVCLNVLCVACIASIVVQISRIASLDSEISNAKNILQKTDKNILDSAKFLSEFPAEKINLINYSKELNSIKNQLNLSLVKKVSVSYDDKSNGFKIKIIPAIDDFELSTRTVEFDGKPYNVNYVNGEILIYVSI